jgi:glutathione S-transferase
MITIFGAYNYPPIVDGIVRHHRALWAAEESGLQYKVHWMDAAKAEHREMPNRGINPFGKIPSLQDGDFKLFESGAIVNYLFEKAGKAPRDLEGRAKLAQWCYAALNTIEPLGTFEIFLWDTFWRERVGRDERRTEVVNQMRARMAELDGALGSKAYLLGDEFSAADVLMATVLTFARSEPTIYEQGPRVRAYLERCQARPGFQRAVAAQSGAPKIAA